MTRPSPEYSEHLRRATPSTLKSPDMDSSGSTDESSDKDAGDSDGPETDSQQTEQDEVYVNPDEILKEVSCYVCSLCSQTCLE